MKKTIILTILTLLASQIVFAQCKTCSGGVCKEKKTKPPTWLNIGPSFGYPKFGLAANVNFYEWNHLFQISIFQIEAERKPFKDPEEGIMGMGFLPLSKSKTMGNKTIAGFAGFSFDFGNWKKLRSEEEIESGKGPRRTVWFFTPSLAGNIQFLWRPSNSMLGAGINLFGGYNTRMSYWDIFPTLHLYMK